MFDGREQDDGNIYQNLDLQAELPSSESSFHATSSSVPSLNSQQRPSRPKKRKEPDQYLSDARARNKRSRASYSDRYRQLFNETVFDIVHGDAPAEHRPLDPGQVGIVNWVTEEKNKLFTAIERHGRHNLPAIATTIVTKADLEVNDFTHLLNDSNVNQNFHGEKSTLIDASTISAAVEISDECNHALENVADALALLQDKQAEDLEKEKYGSQWKLTPAIAKEINLLLGADPDGEATVAEGVPAAVLLNLKAFLDLSSRLFMNSANKEHDWRSFARKREHPSMLFTAFSDFAHLVHALTERLVQTAIFLASSRIRAVDASRHNPVRSVTCRDMKAAVGLLGLESNARDYWTSLARRCRLNVVDGRGRVRKRVLHGDILSYDEVEAVLAGGKTLEDQRLNSSSPGHGAGKLSRPSYFPLNSLPNSPVEVALESEPVSSDEIPSSPALSDSNLSSAHPKIVRRQNQFDYRQLNYASALDHRNSLKEEGRLWDLIAKPLIMNTNLPVVETPKNPGPARKDRDDLVEWRDETNYVAEWELGETSVPAEHFRRNRMTWRKRRRPMSRWEDVEEVKLDKHDTAGSNETSLEEDNPESSTSGISSSEEGGSLDSVEIFEDGPESVAESAREFSDHDDGSMVDILSPALSKSGGVTEAVDISERSLFPISKESSGVEAASEYIDRKGIAPSYEGDS